MGGKGLSTGGVESPVGIATDGPAKAEMGEGPHSTEVTPKAPPGFPGPGSGAGFLLIQWDPTFRQLLGEGAQAGDGILR